MVGARVVCAHADQHGSRIWRVHAVRFEKDPPFV